LITNFNKFSEIEIHAMSGKGESTKPTATSKAPPKGSKTISKARSTSKRNKKGEHSKRSHKIRTKTRFFIPRTRHTVSKPTYARNVRDLFQTKIVKFDKWTVFRKPLATEKAMKKIEDENTLVFLVDPHASKCKIKEAFAKIYNTKVRSVNTLVRY
jgi:large subunit ribosomal protein L23Ae